MHPRHHTLLSATLVLACALSIGCTQVKTVTVEYTVEQTGLVPAPKGPHARGPMVEDGKVALEGGYSGNTVLADDRSRYEGATGNVVVNHALDGRFAVGVGKVELGLDFEYLNASWGTSASSDASPDEVDNESMVHFGPQVRGLFVGDRTRGFGGLAEFSVGNLPYQRSVYERRFLTTWTYQGNPEWWRFPTAKTQLLGDRSRHTQSAEWYFSFRAGLFGTFDVLEGLNVTIGMLGQNVPSFHGVRVVVESCTTFADYPTQCVGENPDDLEVLQTEWLGSVFAAIGYTIGPVTLIGQLYGHPIASDYEIVEASPFGGDLAARISF